MSESDGAESGVVEPDVARSKDGKPTTDSDVVIDLTGPPPSEAASSQGTTAARAESRVRLALVALAVVALVAVVLAVSNYRSAAQWHARALADAERAERTAAESADSRKALERMRAELDAARSERDAIAGYLAVSEADVSALEARIAVLANERAQAEDYGNYAAPADAARQLRALRTQVDSCVAQVASLRTDMAREDVATAAVAAAATVAQAACDQVGADIATVITDESDE